MQIIRFNSSLAFKAKEKLTVSSTALGITSAVYTDTSSTKGHLQHGVLAILSAEDGDMRYWVGATPTTTEGHLLTTGSSVILDGFEAIQSFRAIRTGSTDGTLMVSVYKV